MNTNVIIRGRRRSKIYFSFKMTQKRKIFELFEEMIFIHSRSYYGTSYRMKSGSLNQSKKRVYSYSSWRGHFLGDQGVTITFPR